MKVIPFVPKKDYKINKQQIEITNDDFKARIERIRLSLNRINELTIKLEKSKSKIK